MSITEIKQNRAAHIHQRWGASKQTFEGFLAQLQHHVMHRGGKRKETKVWRCYRNHGIICFGLMCKQSQTWHMSRLATAVARPCTQYRPGCTDEHTFMLLPDCRCRMCTCGITNTHLSPSTSHRSRTQAHIWYLHSKSSVHIRWCILSFHCSSRPPT